MVNFLAVNGTTSAFRIPSRPENGCPTTNFGCYGNDCNHPNKCFCEEHCSWDMCRLFEPPDMCLIEVKGRWIWDSEKGYWVAQLGGRNELYSYCNMMQLYTKDQIL